MRYVDRLQLIKQAWRHIAKRHESAESLNLTWTEY